MIPWLWFWAPQVHFPWSGAVSQHIDPTTTWFSDHIAPQAGNPAIEAQAFAVASYGKQLGLLTELLIGVAEEQRALSPQATRALDRLKAIQAEIEAIKAREYDATADRLAAEVQALRARSGRAFERLAAAVAPASKPSARPRLRS
jgi:hypothetical protein